MKNKKIVMAMIPYPSGSIHMGHMRNYTISDAIARYWRNKGYDVCHPMGWDSYGSPAENVAIAKGVHPKEWTDANIKHMKEQMIKMNISFDWDKEISTCEQSYWKHEQRFFIDMWKAGYIDRKVGIVNWDPIDQTVMANEQVVNGKGWRSGAVIEQKEMVQYYFKTTMFADDMYETIKEVEGKWSEVITKQQKQFIKNGIQEGDKNTPFSDWCISRQRYWGTPIPMINCPKCGTIPNEDVPVIAPYNVKFDGKGNPIANHPTWKYCKCPKCGEDAEKETDTMDTFVQSSWYFVRYISDFDGKKFDYDKIKEWFPIDYYIGGGEHSVSHMIYSRFFWRIFKKMGYIPADASTEPYDKVICQGMVKKDGKKMSKNFGNGVSPDEMVDKYGVDVVRMYIMFAGPPEQDFEWVDTNIIGCSRFMNRFINGYERAKTIQPSVDGKAEDYAKKCIEVIRKKTVDVYERTYKFNTIVASAMETFNAISKQNNPEIWKDGYDAIIDAISPIAPGIVQYRI